MFSSKSETDSSHIFAYIDAVKKQLNPSDNLINTIKQAFILGEERDPDYVKTYVLRNIKNKPWTGIDKDLAYVFSDVFMHSYDFWINASDTKLKKSTLVILYDAGGALHGMIFGPVVSIIEGALLSAALNEKMAED
jgi:ABC-type antimicrobial peptide transport system permease subunit